MSKIIDETQEGENKNVVPEASYMQGLEDGLALWGTICGKQANCEECPLSVIRGANVTCQQFAAAYPQKMASILMELSKQKYTYFDEYCTRFPENDLSVDVLKEIMCRKAVFEGYCSCENSGEACKKCWLEPYVGDVTEFDLDEVEPED